MEKFTPLYHNFKSSHFLGIFWNVKKSACVKYLTNCTSGFASPLSEVTYVVNVIQKASGCTKFE